MPRNRNKPYVCTSCHMIFKGKATTPCPNCGSKETQRLIGKYDPTADDNTADDETPTAPTPPKAPPLPGLPQHGAPKPGGGAITADLLKSVRLKKAVKHGPDVPGPKDSSVPFGVRVLAASIKNPRIPLARFGRPWPRNGPMYYLPNKGNHDLENVLHNIARGMVNLAHGNYNTTYRNLGGELPTRNNPFERIRAHYYEYGWMTSIPSGMWFKWQTGTGAAAPNDVSQRLGGFLRTDGGRMNTERLIFAATGEVFYTPDHYLTFWRYSFKLMDWWQYVSPELRYGKTEPDWDASIYYDTEA